MILSPRKLYLYWFNPPPQHDTPYITDRNGEKYWINWSYFKTLDRLYVSYRGFIAGRVNLLWEKDGGVTLADIVVFYHCRKKDWLRGRGLGKAMLQETIRRAGENGAKYIRGWIQAGEHTSVDYLAEWYRRQGFMVTGHEKFNIFLSLDGSQIEND